jgi:hypothetical protein
MKTIELLLILFFISFINANAQKQMVGYPNDLDKEIIIFLEYEQIPIDEKMSWAQKHMYKSRNNLAPQSNQELRKKVADYPFKYVISSRSVYKDSLVKTCKYVLENDMMEAYNNGVNLYAGMHAQYESPMYIKDLQTGTKYILFSINSNEAYYYTGIMKKINKQVKKKFKIED